jgi:hypothetical protein
MARLLNFHLILLFVSWSSSSVSAQFFESRNLNFADSRQLIIAPGSGGTTGIAVADFNGNGYLDVYFVVHNKSLANDIRTQSRLFQFDGEFYVDATPLAGTGARGITQLIWSQYGHNIGASWGDYNNDGFPDLFLANNGSDLLLKNLGNGRFQDITSKAGVAGQDSLQSSQGLWFDYDTDGDLDLYVATRENWSIGPDRPVNRMYENVGEDEFLDVSQSSGLADSGLTFTTLALDVNNDSHLDLYLANDFGRNKLYLNNGDKTFSENTDAFGLNDWGEGMGLAIGDPDLNGHFDLFLTNVTENGQSELRFNRLFLNSGENIFTHAEFESGVSEAGWGWGTQFADFDNDGDEDLFVSNGYFSQNPPDINLLFLNEFDGVSLEFLKHNSSGIELPSVSFGQVVFDENNDGFLDVLSSHFWQKPVLYTNTQTTGNWIKIELEGVETNRNGFGSVVEVETDGANIKRYYHGAALYSQNILPVHFGLGDASQIEKITVRWLNGWVDEILNVETNQSIKIREYDGLVVSNEFEGETMYPADINLMGNYPNPFNAGTIIQFKVSSPQVVTLEIYNVLGKKVYSSSGLFARGTQSFRWIPAGLHTGLYIYKITSEKGISQSARLLYLK